MVVGLVERMNPLGDLSPFGEWMGKASGWVGLMAE